jgi:hypothetical protein
VVIVPARAADRLSVFSNSNDNAGISGKDNSTPHTQPLKVGISAPKNPVVEIATEAYYLFFCWVT